MSDCPLRTPRRHPESRQIAVRRTLEPECSSTYAISRALLRMLFGETVAFSDACPLEKTPRRRIPALNISTLAPFSRALT